ncbi:MAG: TIGR01777 family protein [Terrimonas sp.]|nr:TIGR01777 family protein [Terrimonas sp.]
MTAATILITGGTGLVGTALTKALLEKGYHVIILTRNPSRYPNPTANPHLCYAGWDVKKQHIDKDALAKADHIIHLAGAGVADKRWSKKRKQEIVDSRVKSSELIVQVLKEYPNKVQTVVSASAIGWYGPDPSIPLSNHREGFIESDPPSQDFLGTTCKQWEISIEPVTDLGKRLVILRTGIVLSNNGGAYVEFIKPLHWGIAAILGNGKQVISWIHIDDLVRMFIHALEQKDLSGPYNAVAPAPISNKALVIEIGKQRRGQFYIPIFVPSFLLKIILGEMSIEVLKSTTVSAARIQATSFTFLFPTAVAAVRHLLGQRNQKG